jgi:hypothetical protein
MSLSVQVSRVKERCGLTSSEFDGEIQNLIGDMVPAAEFALQPSCISETSNTGLQATLSLACLEIVAGEFFAQLCRKPGYAEQIVVAGLELRPYVGTDASDPSGLKKQGLERMRPYLKVDPAMFANAGVGIALGKRGQDP